MTCARCGCGVYKPEDQVVMTKVWHKSCFRCCKCNSILDKSSARLFQGEIFCEQCYDVILDNLKPVPSITNRPCKVCSSPTCVWTDDDTTPLGNNYLNKDDIRIPPDLKKNSTRSIKSCGCISNFEKERSYCFAFPIPREVANYCNRIMRKKNRYCSPNNIGSDDRPLTSLPKTEMGPRIMIRTLSNSKIRNLNKSFEDSSDRCCCSRHRDCVCRCCYQLSPKQEYTFPTNRKSSPQRKKNSPSRRKHPDCFHCLHCHSQNKETYYQQQPQLLQQPQSQRRYRYEKQRHNNYSQRHSTTHRELSDEYVNSGHGEANVCPKCRNFFCPSCPIHGEFPDKRRSKRRDRSNSVKSFDDLQCTDKGLRRKSSITSLKSFDQYDSRRCCQYCRGRSSSNQSEHSSDNCLDNNPPYDHSQYDHPQYDRSKYDRLSFDRPEYDYPEYDQSEHEPYRHISRSKYDQRNVRENNKHDYRRSPFRNQLNKEYVNGKEKFEKYEKKTKHCICGQLNPCNCKMSKIRAECTSLCVRCNRKVYVAERISTSSGPFHNNCFCCYCCSKPLDVKTVYEHNGEVFCRSCYNTFLGSKYYGFGVQ